MIALRIAMQPKDPIVILHKSGAPSHYRGLEHLLEERGVKSLYREFSIASRLFKGLMRWDFKLVNKQIKNLSTLIQLKFTSGSKVVLGIAPYDRKLPRVLKVLKGHQIYYHTSWPNWDGLDYPKRKSVTRHLKMQWKDFIENQVTHIFAVTETAKNSLTQNYDLNAPVSVVGHAFDPSIFQESYDQTEFKACFVGRLTSQKGIDDLILWSKEHEDYNVAFMGSGDLETHVKKAAEAANHITYIPKTTNMKDVRDLLQSSEYLLLNCKKTQRWQELFGMVIIEAMACGCIPIATDHVGPRELIENKVNGYLLKEEEFELKLSSILDQSPSSAMKHAAMKRAARFTLAEVAQKWEPILKNHKDG